MTHAALFDLDGTLIDTPRAITATFEAVLARMDAQPRAAAAIRATIGLPLDKAFGSLLGVAPDDDRVGEGIDHYQALFGQIVLPRARELVFPGVLDGLHMLRARGVALAVATSKFSSSANILLKAAGLRDVLSLVVGADEVANPKPDPEMAHRVLRGLGLGPESAVMVGDTTHDVLMARRAGLRSIAVTYGVHDIEKLKGCRPTWMAGTFDEVLVHILAARSPAT